MYTIRMIISPNAAELLIFCEEAITSVSISVCESRLPAFLTCRRCTIASTIITAPSTINPKSIAPKLIRLADIPNKFIIETANSIARGMTEATINPALQLPSRRTNIKMTIKPPSIRFFLTVPIAVFTSLSLTK